MMYDTQNLPLGVTRGISVDDEHALVVYDIYGPKPTGVVGSYAHVINYHQNVNFFITIYYILFI